MDLSQAVEWNREENVDVSHAILLSKVPLNVGNDIVSRVLNTVCQDLCFSSRHSLNVSPLSICFPHACHIT